jgi:hypothetical protein
MTAIVSTDMIAIKNPTFLAWANAKIYMPFGYTNKKGMFIHAYIYPTVVVALTVVVSGRGNTQIQQIRTLALCDRRQPAERGDDGA